MVYKKKGIKLNVSKTKHLRITFKNVNLKKYTINNVEIETVVSHKHFGVIIDNKLSFNPVLIKLFLAADRIHSCDHMTLIDCNVNFFLVTDHL